jgi:hypothetical protein
MKVCTNCRLSKSEEDFYKKSGQAGFHSRCKECFLKLTNARQQRNRTAAIESRGSKCSICGYNRCVDVLEFHHVDPSTKDPGYHNWTSWTQERAGVELAKCVLLCPTCHSEVEVGFRILER